MMEIFTQRTSDERKEILFIDAQIKVNPNKLSMQSQKKKETETLDTAYTEKDMNWSVNVAN